MANAREIQNRIKSIQDTRKITNAMYLISSTKLKKSKKLLEDTEPYFYTLQSLIRRILRHMGDTEHPYFNVRKEIKEEDRVRGLVVITGDKGLAGAYNHNVLKLAHEWMEKSDKNRLYVVGELGRQYFAARHVPVEEQFHYTVQNPTLGRTRTIAERVMEYYTQGKLDRVYIIYTKMINSMSSQPELIRLLPLRKADYLPKVMDLKGTPGELVDMLPSPEELLDHIVKNTVAGFIYSALVESYASEQNARMLAMQSATDSAKEMLKDLNIVLNRVRQASITQEITEVISGARAQKNKK